MVVAYLLSQGRQQGADDLSAALVAAQMKLPGLRCIVGESIPVASILAQHIENQVKVSDRLGVMLGCAHACFPCVCVFAWRWRPVSAPSTCCSI